MDDGSRRAGMVHAVILRSGAADAAAGATGMAAFMIHLHRVGVKRLDSSEEIVRAPCGGSSSSTANKHFCVLSTYYQLTSVQRARDVRACLRAVRAPRREIWAQYRSKLTQTL